MEQSATLPVAQKTIPFSKVCCQGNELTYLKAVLDSGWLTTAGKARAFEESFAEAVGARFACAVNSCTAALHLALEALGVGPGDKVFGDDSAKIIVDRKSFLYLNGTELDYNDGLMQSGFSLHNPNVKRSCGCGASFTV